MLTVAHNTNLFIFNCFGNIFGISETSGELDASKNQRNLISAKKFQKFYSEEILRHENFLHLDANDDTFKFMRVTRNT